MFSSRLGQVIQQFANIISVYIAGQVIKRALGIFSDKVDGQQAVAEKKSKLIYAALDAHPESYKVCLLICPVIDLC
jgi:acid stress-induced BolA-like protein IbaG/YrbA